MTTAFLLLGLAGIFAGIFLVFASVGVFTGERSGKYRSLAAIEAISTAPRSMRRELQLPFADRALRPVLAFTARVGARIAPSGWSARIDRALVAAGSPQGWDVPRVTTVKTLSLALGAIVGGLLATTIGASPGWFLLSPILGLAAWFVPDALLYQLAYERSESIRRELPDAIDLLTISVEAGLGFDAAVQKVASHASGSVAAEFARLLAEMQVGRSRSEAITAMAERTDVEELRSFSSAMVQADTFGVPIASVLRVQSKELRVKRRQRAEEKAQKVPVKLLFPLVFLILPCIFIIVLGPSVLTLLDSLSGRV
jgi:tight adherence protein C